jgi:trehalose/maltose hydrolase-like predicted phosphorylase
MQFESPDGKKLQIAVIQFVSRKVPSLLCQQIELKPEEDMNIEVIASIDYSRLRVEFAHIYEKQPIPLSVYFTKKPYYENVALMAGFKSKNKLGIAVYIDLDPEFVKGDNEEDMSQNYLLNAKGGKIYRISTLAAMVSEIYHPAPEQQAVRMAGWGKSMGFKKLRKDNHDAWKELWKSRVKVYGDPEAQKGLDIAFFYLMSSVHPSSKTGLAPFGLSQYHNYFGHIFWDMDTWMFVPILLVSPESARSLLECRVRGLDAAKGVASLFGYQGAHYSWEASPIDGAEVTPASVATGWAQHHVVADIAIAFWEYQRATGDEIFLRDGTWPVLKAAAQWIESRGVFTKRGFEIHDVMGFDESMENITNNAHMNLSCEMAMNAAIECAKKIGINPPDSWTKISESFVIPIDEDNKIILPYDNPPPPSDVRYSNGSVQFLFLHDPPLSNEYIKNTYFYEEQCLYRNPEDYPWPKWNVAHVAAPYAVLAAFYGDKEKAKTLFDVAWKPYSIDPFGIAKEFRKTNFGAFITSYGSLLHSVMLGFTGLRISENDWSKYPTSLPKGWDRIEIDQIWIKGIPKKVVAVDGQLPTLTH